MHEKILEGENFGESSLMKQKFWLIYWQVFSYFIVLIDFGGENFCQSSIVCQICQNFPFHIQEVLKHAGYNGKAFVVGYTL